MVRPYSHYFVDCILKTACVSTPKLGGSGGMLPHRIFWVFKRLRQLLVTSRDTILDDTVPSKTVLLELRGSKTGVRWSNLLLYLFVFSITFRRVLQKLGQLEGCVESISKYFDAANEWYLGRLNSVSVHNSGCISHVVLLV